jgi:APA family basic amino acid/polyamine antiporter
MFVAYTGYGRIATLGEEVHDPRRSIPRAIIVTLVATAAIYALVAFVAVASAGSDGLAEATKQAAAPLEVIARGFDIPGVAWLVAAGAVTAMLGVLLNLLLGLSRVVLAMARRGDMPTLFARVDEKRSSPVAAVLLVGGIIAGLAAIGSVETTWSFSAFTVLVYYALTNLAALRLPPEARLYPQWIPAAGLVCCLGLSFWVEPVIWAAGLGLIAVGLVWHGIARRVSGRAAAPN